MEIIGPEKRQDQVPIHRRRIKRRIVRVRAGRQALDDGLGDVAAGLQGPQRVGEGDAPAISAQGKLVFLRDGAVFTVKSEGAEPTKLFFDRGKDARLAWSPDGSKLAFVSNRDDHAFIGVWSGETTPITWLAPSTGTDGSPIWSPSGAKLAFTRQPGEGGPPSP